MGRNMSTQRQPYVAISDQYFSIGYVDTNTGVRREDVMRWSYQEAMLKTYWTSNEVFLKFLEGEISLPSSLEGESNIQYFVCWKRRAI